VNGHMLHALGITHVVSVGTCKIHSTSEVPRLNWRIGECAILPPEETSPTFGIASGKPHGYGSLWLEEREGRIKVLDIQVGYSCFC
jgi:dual specificity MAP kinase phosphatase